MSGNELSTGDEAAELEKRLVEAERSLATLKDRYVQIQQARRRRAELRQRISRIELQPEAYKQQKLQQELQQLQQALQATELDLESRLLSLSSFKEPFWQAVRFGGIGVVVGWLLKTWAS